jgi:hypothetical protein
MSETPAERFRRILKGWRETEQQKKRPGVAVTPDGSAASTQVAPTTRQPAPRTIPPTPEPESSRAPQRLEAPATSMDRSAHVRPALPDATSTAVPPPRSSEIPHLEPALDLDTLKTPSDARHFLERLRAKITQVVQDYSSGVINQRQFQAIYSHYQRQRVAVEKALIEMPGSGAWRAAATEGLTSFLRQQHAAQVLGYTVYETASGAQLTQVGEFDPDDKLLEKTLSEFRSGEHAQFGAGLMYTEIEGGRWLCCVPGRYTTLAVIFSAEPATIQLNTIRDSHRDFELVNETSVSRGDISQLTHTFTHLWAFDQGPIEP